jgi:hypothetical protein|mmetsp:Transcript_357/g.498  ORF Transcript_357/g.498 Transcript_357/m.498 type:complete len:183 (+) Transcript_357:28-576(+)
MDELPPLFVRGASFRRPDVSLQRPMSAPSLEMLESPASPKLKYGRRAYDRAVHPTSASEDCSPNLFWFPSDVRDPELYGRSAGMVDGNGHARSLSHLPSLSRSRLPNPQNGRVKCRVPIPMSHLASDRYESEEQYKKERMRRRSTQETGIGKFRRASWCIVAANNLSGATETLSSQTRRGSI